MDNRWDNHKGQRPLLSLCQANAKLEPIAAWKRATIGELPQNDKFGRTNFCISREYPILFKAPLFKPRDTFIMNNCVHNSYVGLRNRYLKETGNDVTFDREIVEQLLDEFVEKVKPHFNGRIDLKEFLEPKTGQLRQRYDEACAKVYKNGFNVKKMNKISAFIKNELYDEVKAPRMIMGRDPRFNLLYGQYTTALEHACVAGIPQFSKGKNFAERGEQFRSLVYGEEYCEGDFSKFESTQRLELLEIIELGVWKRLSNMIDFSEMKTIFYSKMEKQGTSTQGLKFKFYACRGSGDMDTGLFNTVISWVACRYFEIVNNLGTCGNFIVDGDDNVVKIPKGRTFKDTFSSFGLDAKLIHKKNYWDLDYCSGKFIMCNRTGDFLYVQNFAKVFVNAAVFKKVEFANCVGHYYYSLGFMYQVLYAGLELMEEFGKFLCRFTKNKTRVSMAHLVDQNPAIIAAFREKSPYYHLIDNDVVKHELFISMGISPIEYELLLDYFRNCKIDLPLEKDNLFKKKGFNKFGWVAGHYEVVDQILHGRG